MPMKQLLCLLLALIVLIGTAACTPTSPKDYALSQENAGLTVHFIDVGQGDSTLLESNGEFVLVDAGERDYGETVLRYIQSRGAQTLKYIIATHPHSDHIGGIRTVLDGIKTENFITVETDCDTYSWLKTLRKVDALGVRYIDAVPGDTYRFGNAGFTILAPLADGYEGYNNYSVVIRAEYGDVRFLMTGDAEEESEAEMLEAGEDLRADVLKCGHHGSSDATTAPFLKAVNPSYAVISCGSGNDYGHPHRETLQKLGALGCAVYRTDLQGNIIAHTDGQRLEFSTQADTGGTVYSPLDTRSPTVYIGNRSSHIFHNPDCDGVQTMNPNNQIEFESRDEALGQGYTPCPRCNP